MDLSIFDPTDWNANAHSVWWLVGRGIMGFAAIGGIVWVTPKIRCVAYMNNVFSGDYKLRKMVKNICNVDPKLINSPREDGKNKFEIEKGNSHLEIKEESYSWEAQNLFGAEWKDTSYYYTGTLKVETDKIKLPDRLAKYAYELIKKKKDEKARSGKTGYLRTQRMRRGLIASMHRNFKKEN